MVKKAQLSLLAHCSVVPPELVTTTFPEGDSPMKEEKKPRTKPAVGESLSTGGPSAWVRPSERPMMAILLFASEGNGCSFEFLDDVSEEKPGGEMHLVQSEVTLYPVQGRSEAGTSGSGGIVNTALGVRGGVAK